MKVLLALTLALSFLLCGCPKKTEPKADAVVTEPKDATTDEKKADEPAKEEPKKEEAPKQ